MKMRWLLLCPVLPLLGSCTGDCASPDRLDGSYVLWSNVLRHDPDPVAEDYPTRDVFYNGYSTWTLGYDPSRSGFEVLIEVTRDSDSTNDVGQQGYSASYFSTDKNCNVFDLDLSGTFLGEKGSVSEFTWTGTLTSIGSHLGGRWEYTANWSVETEKGTSTGSVETSGEVSGNIGADQEVDTGFER